MSTTTPRYGLVKNQASDYQDDAIVANQNANMDMIEQELGAREDEIANHKAAATLDHPDNSVTDTKIGSRTISDTSAPTGATGLLGVLLNWIGYILKAVTGKGNWWTAPAISLETLSVHKTRHQPGGADAIPTAAPGDLGASAAEGSSTSLARADHTHPALDNTNPADVGTAAAPGTSAKAARRDHVHKVGDGAATDAAIGNRTISDADAPTGDTGLLAVLLGWLAYQLKSITGKTNWRTAPAANLETLNGKFHQTDGHKHTGAAGDAPDIFDPSLSANGYIIFPNGLIIQWGSVQMGGVSSSIQTAAVSFPMQFPNSLYVIAGTVDNHANATWGVVISIARGQSTSGFTAYLDTTQSTKYLTNTINYKWIALGR